jgi:hypothetical protein
LELQLRPAEIAGSSLVFQLTNEDTAQLTNQSMSLTTVTLDPTDVQHVLLVDG